MNCDTFNDVLLNTANLLPQNSYHNMLIYAIVFNYVC